MDFELQSYIQEELEKENEEQKNRDLIKEGITRKLQGDSGDLTADLFGEGPTPLFNEKRQ